MKQITLGSTGIVTQQNAFGALPIQRCSEDEAVKILRRAYDGGMTFFDTARAYSDSEEKLGKAFGEAGLRNKIYIATKTMASDAQKLESDLETSLRNLKTDHVDILQLHCVPKCYAPGDESGLYEALLKAKQQGKILHIGITAHKIGVAEDIVESGLYETLQFPFSYLASDRDEALVAACEKANMGFIAMKGLSGGLLNNAAACMAFVSGYNALPIWGIQRMSELEQWLKFFDEPAQMTKEIADFIEKDRQELLGDFCRGCGYCAPCSVDIIINQCARMSQMIRRAPTAAWVSPYWQSEMMKIENCIDCGLCMTRCPYELKIPTLLRKNLEDYKRILAGEVKV